MGHGREAAYMKYRDGLPWAEVAQKLGTTYDGARNSARRYRRQHPEEFPSSNASSGAQPRTTASFEVKGNHAKAVLTSPRVRSLEDLIKACNIDLEVWKVDKWGAKCWEAYAANEKKDMVFDEGKITGTVFRDGIITEPLWSVWASLVRIAPVAIFPTIRPIECNVTYSVPERPRKSTGIGRALLFADPQFGFTRRMEDAKLYPFHDRAALDIVLQLAAHIQPDRIDCLGDFMDFSMWTDKYLRSPEYEYTTQPALCEGHWWLRQLREACPGATINLHEGNHDKRMRDQIAMHLRAACDLRPADELDMPPVLSPQRLLSLHKLGITWYGDYPKDSDWINNGLRVMHGDLARSGAGLTAKAYIEKIDASVVVGHTHREEKASKTKWTIRGSETITAHCIGCLCKIDGDVPGSGDQENWQQGCAVVDYDEGGEDYALYYIPIRSGLAFWDREEFVGRDRTEDLRSDMPKMNW